MYIYGPSVFTVGLQDWPRHRNAVSRPFNEAIMKFVWDESLRQTQAMVQYWTSGSEAGITDMQENMRTLSLNVLAVTAFRESYDFRGSPHLEDDKAGTQSYRDALFIVHKYAIHLMLIPYRFLTGPMTPRSLAKIGLAATSLKGFMMKMVTEEAAALSRGEPGSGGLITHLVRALDQKTPQRTGSGDDVKKAGKGGLSVDEILGNIFVINFAGHDTTAITLAFAVMLLAAHPEVQEWLHEEITTVTQRKPVEDWDYALFSRLKRCHAVFFETLRVYPPITGLPKITSEKVQALRVGDRVLALPPGTETYPMVLGVQTDPNYWGGDPYVWRPSRWIVPSGAAAGTVEELLVPQKGTFCPWADGPQGCAGKKFSQVEAVAMLACLFKTHRLHPKTQTADAKDEPSWPGEARVRGVWTNWEGMKEESKPKSPSAG
ncbi:hypothetical protein DL764_009994 [Monosporascus ibericus]|uniref:Cytochrome P450 n=1 Tax=Monosporascus ibericus TaxID=155417 RepID=A0A4Q4STM6_9PEZI|nr:hypothetical protein DL764_009994 [Monosporascus ibericus]